MVASVAALHVQPNRTEDRKKKIPFFGAYFPYKFKRQSILLPNMCSNLTAKQQINFLDEALHGLPIWQCSLTDSDELWLEKTNPG